MSDSKVIVCCGTGGVGKTTLSAALAVGYAVAGHRTVVLTIDPARRLADALAINALDNHPREVDLSRISPDAAVLHALMLDRKATWDEAVRRFAPDPDLAESLLANRYYQAVSTRLTGSHEYMAVEKLYELAESDRWDVIVVDTLPAQHALDFFKAPERVRRLLDQRAIGALLNSDGSSGLIGIATRRVASLIRRLAGESVMADLTSFFGLFASLSGGFSDRAQQVDTLLHGEATTYVLVAAASAATHEPSLDFVNALRERGLDLNAVFLNRVVPSAELSRPVSSEWLPGPPQGVTAEAWSSQLAALGTLVDRYERVANHHSEIAQALHTATGAPVYPVPQFPDGVRSLERLAALAQALPPAARRPAARPAPRVASSPDA